MNGPAACAQRGPAGLLASGAWLRSAFADLHFEILDADAAGERVWVRLRMQGRHAGTFVQFEDGVAAKVLPPTGRRIDAEQIHLRVAPLAGQTPAFTTGHPLVVHTGDL